MDGSYSKLTEIEQIVKEYELDVEKREKEFHFTDFQMECRKNTQEWMDKMKVLKNTNWKMKKKGKQYQPSNFNRYQLKYTLN